MSVRPRHLEGSVDLLIDGSLVLLVARVER